MGLLFEVVKESDSSPPPFTHTRGHARRPGPEQLLKVLFGREVEIDRVGLDFDREYLDLILLPAQARPGLEGERLLVEGACDLGDAALIAEDAA